MLDDVLAIPDHLRDALWRIESARIAPVDSAGLIVCGMGGSAIGGDLAAAALADRLTRPLLTIRGYELPTWTSSEWTVLCSTYSGETEETLACFKSAGELDAGRVVATTGGSIAAAARDADVPVIGLPGILPAPRSAVAYMFAIGTEVAALAGAGPSIRAEIEAAATALEGRRDELQELAAKVAADLDESLPVFTGAGLTAAAARRWKGQINENAKLPAFFSDLPEADHNELCGWAGASAVGAKLAAVFLEDREQHPRERRRFELTAQAIEADGATVIRIETAGKSRTERLLWAVMLGDLVSLAVAERRGVDPLPVEAIEGLKAALGRR